MLQCFVGNLLNSLYTFLEPEFKFLKGCVLVLTEKVCNGWVQAYEPDFINPSLSSSWLWWNSWKNYYCPWWLHSGQLGMEGPYLALQWRKIFQFVVDWSDNPLDCSLLSEFLATATKILIVPCLEWTVVNFSYDVIQRLVELLSYIFQTFLWKIDDGTLLMCWCFLKAPWALDDFCMVVGLKLSWRWQICCPSSVEYLCCPCCNSLGDLVVVVAVARSSGPNNSAKVAVVSKWSWWTRTSDSHVYDMLILVVLLSMSF